MARKLSDYNRFVKAHFHSFPGDAKAKMKACAAAWREHKGGKKVKGGGFLADALGAFGL